MGEISSIKISIINNTPPNNKSSEKGQKTGLTSPVISHPNKHPFVWCT